MSLNNKNYETINHQFSAEIKNKLQPLSLSDNWHSLFAVVFDFSIIFGAICLGKTTWFFYPLSVLIIASRQRALASIFHDAVHNRAAKWKPLNSFIGKYLSGYLIFQSFKAYRKSHVIMHHGFLGDYRKDPDFQFYLELGLYNDISKEKFLWNYVISPLILLKSITYLSYLLKHRTKSFTNNQKELGIMITYCISIISLIYYLGYLEDLFFYWIIPYFTIFPVIGYIIEVAEHYPLIGSYSPIIYSARNRYSHWIESFFCSIHNENYHLTHHLRPNIPFWNLRKAHKIMLQDEIYKNLNEQFGGIFISSNNNQALFPALIQGKLKIPNKMIFQIDKAI